MDWNIKYELENLHRATGDSDVPWSVAAVTESQITQVRDWHRGGSETYIYVFAATGPTVDSTFVAKALVAPLLGTPPEKQIDRWLDRRARLVEKSVRVPELLGVGKGLLVERFVEFSLQEAAVWVDVRTKYMELVERVLDAGFVPTDFVHNIRTDGRVLYWVDFGEDLGAYARNADTRKDAFFEKALQEIDALSRASIN
jgi:hypothetical protein